MAGPADDIRAIAFDLDGTLVDTAPDIAQALNTALCGAGLATFDVPQVRAWVGDGPDVLIERALLALGREPAAPLRAELRSGFDAATLAAPLVHGTVFDGVRSLLQQLQGAVPMVVVTNKPSALSRAVLEAAGLLPHLGQVFGADVAAWRKPAPALLLRAAQHLNVQPRQLLMVGDSGADMRCAYAAGAPTALAAWGYGAHALPQEPTWRIGHPREVLDIVQARR